MTACSWFAKATATVAVVLAAAGSGLAAGRRTGRPQLWH